MIEAIVLLWLLWLFFVDIRVRDVEKRLDKLEKELKKEG
jgi:hypothetical protein